MKELAFTILKEKVSKDAINPFCTPHPSIAPYGPKVELIGNQAVNRVD